MEQLEAQISEYESQLVQVQLAISELTDGLEKNNLSALEADLKEVIMLSKKSLTEALQLNKPKDDLLCDEYNLFKAELANLERGGDQPSELHTSVIENNEELVKELNSLQGTKCQAPYMYKWTNDVTYHNAFISHTPDIKNIKNYNEIEVRVMFTNPTHKEMQPCPYYLEGDCKFNDGTCRYSHGELVLLNTLKEYKEPIFSELGSGSGVFAKQSDGLWYRAQVLSIADGQCKVKFESNSREETIPLHNIFPLDGQMKESSDSDDSDSSNITTFNAQNTDNEIVQRVLRNPPGSVLGEWEKFTKGFGSRMLAKMGYIYGSGLGKNGMGRLEPVPATIFPPGKSLDHCLMLKEKAGNDKDLFKAERKLKKLQRKHEEKLKKTYEMEKEKTDVFTFLNTTLELVKPNEKLKPDEKKTLRNESIRDLNVSCLQLSEEMRKVEKEIKNLSKSLSRHSPCSQPFKMIKDKLSSHESRLLELHNREKKIKNEQAQRRDREKLTVF